MTFAARTGALGSTFTIALIGLALRTVRMFAAALKNRSEVRNLYELDDRALKDIGLMRSDIVSALDIFLRYEFLRRLASLSYMYGLIRSTVGRVN